MYNNNKRFLDKKWVKIIAILILGIFLFNQPVYARHITRDKNFDKLFSNKDEIKQSAFFVGGVILSIAVPVIMVAAAPAVAAASTATVATTTATTTTTTTAATNVGFNASAAAANAAQVAAIQPILNGIVVSGCVNASSQLANAFLPDSKNKSMIIGIVGGVVGGLATGSLNLANATSTLTTAEQVWTVAQPTLSWTAASAASAFAGKKNPFLGSLAGLVAGQLVSVCTQYVAHATTGLHQSADGKPITEQDAHGVYEVSDTLKDMRDLQQMTNPDAGKDIPSAVVGANGRVYGSLVKADQANLPIIPSRLGTMNSAQLKDTLSVNGLSETLQQAAYKANDIMLTTGGPYTGVNGQAIVHNSFPGAVAQAFRSISPGQWASLAVSAGVYELLQSKYKDKMGGLGASPQLIASLAGSAVGPMINQWDGLGKAWSGTNEAHSPWYNPQYRQYCVQNMASTIIGAGIQYGLDRLESKVFDKQNDSSGLERAFFGGAARFIAGGLASGVINKVFLTDEKSENMQKLTKEVTLGLSGDQLIHPEVKAFSLGRILGNQFRSGALYVANEALPIFTPTMGINDGYNAITYGQIMVQKFATGADYASTMVYNVGRGMAEAGENQVRVSAVDSIFNRGRVFYGDFTPQTKAFLMERSWMSREKLGEMFGDGDRRRYGDRRRLDYATAAGLLAFDKEGKAATLPLVDFDTYNIRFAPTNPAIPNKMLEPLNFSITDVYGTKTMAFSAVPQIARLRTDTDATLRNLTDTQVRDRSIKLLIENEEFKKKFETWAASIGQPNLDFASLSTDKQETMLGRLPEADRKDLLAQAVGELCGVDKIMKPGKSLRDYVEITDKTVKGDGKEYGQWKITFASPRTKADIKIDYDGFFKDYPKMLNIPSQEASVETGWSNATGEKNVLLIKRKNVLLLNSVTLYDKYNLPVYSLNYSAAIPELANKLSEARIGRNEKPLVKIGNIVRKPGETYRKSIETFFLQKEPTFASRVIQGFIPGSGSVIDDALNVSQGEVYYYGALGRKSLTESTPIFVPENNVAGKERMFLGYDRGRLSDYLRCLEVRGSISDNVTNIMFDRAKLYDKDFVNNKFTKTYSPLIRSDNAKAWQLLAMVDELASKNLISKQEQKSIEGELNFRISESLTDNTYLEGVYNKLVGLAGSRVWEEQSPNLGKYKSFEKGIFVDDLKERKRAMLPEFTEKFAYRKDGTLWAQETDKFIYQGLERGSDKEGNPILLNKGKEIDKLGKKGFMFGGVEIKTAPDREIVDFGGYQVIDNSQDIYSARGNYSSSLSPRSDYGDWGAFISEGANERRIMISPIEEERARQRQVNDIVNELARGTAMGNVK